MKLRNLRQTLIGIGFLLQLTGCATYHMKQLEVTVLDHQTQKPVPHVPFTRMFDPFHGCEDSPMHWWAFSQTDDYETDDHGRCDLELPITYDVWLDFENPKNERESVNYHFVLNGYPIGEFKYIKPGTSRTINGVTYSCFHNIQHFDAKEWKLSYEHVPFESDRSAFDVRIREKPKNQEVD